MFCNSSISDCPCSTLCPCFDMVAFQLTWERESRRSIKAQEIHIFQTLHSRMSRCFFSCSFFTLPLYCLAIRSCSLFFCGNIITQGQLAASSPVGLCFQVHQYCEGGLGADSGATELKPPSPPSCQARTASCALQPLLLTSASIWFLLLISSFIVL